MKNVIGIDLGGTSIDCGRIEEARIAGHLTTATQGHIGGQKTLDLLKSLIAELITEETEAVGIGVPSVVDRDKGIVYNVQNIAGWDEVHLKEAIEAEFGIPVFVDNDANCFAYGEKIYGKGQRFRNFVGVTLGTGLGAGIIQDHRLLSDANCGSGEFGEIPYMGTRLEEFCGSRFFPATAGLSGKKLAEKARNGEEAALKVFDEYGKHLAYLVKIIVLVLDPQAIIFGGSIARSFDLFKNAILGGLSDFPYPKSIERLEIMASGQKDIGILGAGSLCFSTENGERLLKNTTLINNTSL